MNTLKGICLAICCLIPLLSWGQQTHKVKKGETIYAISRLYDISPEELEAANPDVLNHNIKKGMLLIVPTKRSNPVSPTQEATTLQVGNVATAEPMPTPRTHYESLRIGVLLPLEEQSERAAKIIEFYRGFLMAADSVRGEGHDLHIFTWHCGKSAEEMHAVLNRVAQEKLDVIFGPADAVQVPSLAAFCTERDIRLVLPFSHNMDLDNHPLVYSATPTPAHLAKLAAKLVLDTRSDRHYVFVHTNNPDPRGSLFTEHLRREMSARNINPSVFNIEADETALEMALSEHQTNCIITNNTSIRTLNILLSRLDGFRLTHPQFTFSLQGYPEWQAYTSSHLSELFSFDTYAYSNYFKNPLSPQTASFRANFTHNFSAQLLPSIPQYAMMGFDLGYFFMHGLCSLGDNFDQQCNMLTYKPFQHPFKFVREKDGAGFTNSAIELIHYTPLQTLEIVTPL